MRAGPLSNSRVIELLNGYFVPVYLSNEDFELGAAASEEERAELRRIHRQGHERQLSVGSVHVYLLAPDGKLLNSLHVAEAAKPKELQAALEGVVRQLDLVAGEPVIAPTSQSQRPEVSADQLVLHLAARSLKPGGAWGDFPAENWLTLDRSQWEQFLPPQNDGPTIAVGDTWEIDSDVTAALLLHFYPATENNDAAKNEIAEQQLRATVLSVAGYKARVRLDGALRMKHNFYYKDDGRVVEAALVGYLDIDLASRQLLAFRLLTDGAQYGPGTFGVALRSLE